MASLKLFLSLPLIFYLLLPSTTTACDPSGTVVCKGRSYPQFTCLPTVASYTSAKLTLTDFSRGGEGGDRSECENQFHDNNELVVALSTGWYDGGSRCGRVIVISASSATTGRSVAAKVVDECDSVRGCNKDHAGLPPCGNNIVDASAGVWNALGLNKRLGVVDVSWIMAE
ncbi:kiwellin-like [Pyrus communis]|uniref:kiwellin-like n=1 Tax=Pyrus communis TaxID=23211 RepID=UPI0035C109B2